MVNQARIFAYDKHQHMTISDGKPYSVHLEKVVENLFKFFKNPPPELIAACLLHDTVEDTETTLEEIEQLFGPTVRDLVYRVTDEEGTNRHDRKMKTYPKIANNLGATIVKLCDRIANVEYPSPKKESYREMYRKEQIDFEKICRVSRFDGDWVIVDQMWEHLTNSLND